MKAEIKGKQLIITLDLETTPSKKEGGVLTMIASSKGFKETALEYKGKTVRVNAMAGFKE